VYNFQVGDWHNYFVSKINILVHNKNSIIQWDTNSTETIQQLLQGTGQLKDLRHCGNLKGFDVNLLLQKTPGELELMLKNKEITKKP